MEERGVRCGDCGLACNNNYCDDETCQWWEPIHGREEEEEWKYLDV